MSRLTLAQIEANLSESYDKRSIRAMKSYEGPVRTDRRTDGGDHRTCHIGIWRGLENRRGIMA